MFQKHVTFLCNVVITKRRDIFIIFTYIVKTFEYISKESHLIISHAAALHNVANRKSS